MNSFVKAIELFEPMAPVESSKSEMLSLADGAGWAPVIMARVFVPPPHPFFTWVLDVFLLLWPHSKSVAYP